MRKLLDYLYLRDVGLLELTFALTPMLSGYSFLGFPLSLGMWLILLFVVFLRQKRIRLKNFMPFTLFVVYWLLKQFIVVLFDDVNFFGFVQQIILFLSLYALYPFLKREKLRGALNWIMLISIIGLISQWIEIAQGVGVHPIKIPGFSLPDNRIEDSFRPSSFFMEPAAYVAYAICPLTFALIDRKWIWAAIIIISTFLTTSTTGLLLSFAMLITSLFGNRFNVKSSIMVLVLMGGLFYSLTHFEIFESGINKLETIDTEGNIRLRQGPNIVSTMHTEEYFMGVNYSTPYNYCNSGRISDVAVYGKEEVYMSTFWYLILLYGVAGLLLYTNVYFSLLKRNRKVLPLVAALFATLFSSSYVIGNIYIFTLILLLVMTENNELDTLCKKRSGGMRIIDSK